MNKKGNVGSKMTALIGVLVILVVAGALVGTYFTAFNSSNVGANAPSWFSSTIIIVIAAGILMLIWSLFNKYH